MQQTKLTLAVLYLIGLGGALFESSILAGSTLLLALVGFVIIKKSSLYRAGWETPKELRLMHFAFWFFVLISVISWALSGFTYEGTKTLGTHARFILFWPLIIALTYARSGANTTFIAVTLIPAAAAVIFLLDFQDYGGGFSSYLNRRFGGGINPISFGNIALLGSVMTWAGCLYFWSQKRKTLAILCLVIGLTGLYISLLSQTRSNLVALPLLLLLFLPLTRPGMRIAATLGVVVIVALALYSSERVLSTIAQFTGGSVYTDIQMRLETWRIAWQLFSDSPWTGSGLDGYHAAATAFGQTALAPQGFLNCCSNHAHNDVLQTAATRGLPGVLSWLFLLVIPFTVFVRQITNSHKPTACLAAAGAMLPVGYFAFGLTEATFDRSLPLTFYLLATTGLASAMFTELSGSYTRQRQVRVSATIITMNEEDHIADCLRSAGLVADEIILLDSGSTDRTVEIAKEYADVVEVTDWPGFGLQKQRALEKATGDWILSLDADERISPELGREINHRLAAPDADAYKLPWAVTIYGKRLDFGRSGRAPLRLFRRKDVRFSDALVHERILIPKGRKIKTLRGRLTHYTHRHFGHSLEKSAKYAWLGALEKHRKGKKTRTMIYPTLRGLLTFVQVYFIRFGFLDGAVGYLTAVTYAQVTFNKYAGLWTLKQDQDPSSPHQPDKTT